MWKDLSQTLNRAGVYRVASLLLICAGFTLLVRHGFSPHYRALTVIGMTATFSLVLAYELVVRDISETILGISLLILWAAMTGLYLEVQRSSPPKKIWSGPILAGDLRTPSTGCDGKASILSGDYFLMIFGTDAVVGQGDGPFKPIRIGTCPALTFTRQGNQLRVDGAGYDESDDYVYEIKDNVFQEVIGGSLVPVRDQKDRLDIVDADSGKQSLRIQFLNPHAVRVTGLLHCGAVAPITITDVNVRIGKTVTRGHLCQQLQANEDYGIEYSSASVTP
jgi:hypothetical protein